MEIYICDDSRPDLMRLAHHLKEYILNLDMHVEIRSFSSGESILAAYKRALVKPSLIFLDIYMGNMNGMDVARALRDDGFSGGIIFTTSSTAHAMDSYNVDCIICRNRMTIRILPTPSTGVPQFSPRRQKLIRSRSVEKIPRSR